MICLSKGFLNLGIVAWQFFAAEAVLCIVGCLAASQASNHYMLPPQVVITNMSLDIIEHPLGGTITPAWEPLQLNIYSGLLLSSTQGYYFAPVSPGTWGSLKTRMMLHSPPWLHFLFTQSATYLEINACLWNKWMNDELDLNCDTNVSIGLRFKET